MQDSEATIRGWHSAFAAAVAASAGGRALPEHSPQCLGCGPDNPHGYHLEVRRDGDRVRARHRFDARHIGAPGVAHGGAVAAVLDDLCGFVLYVIGQIAVTRNLSVNYHAPARLEVPYDLAGWLTHREGRKIFIQAEGRDPDGRLAFSADAVFLAVDTAHFIRANTTASTTASTTADVATAAAPPPSPAADPDLPGNP